MRVRPPSPALVISCLALLLALGGTSFAALTATGNAVNIVDPVTAANKAKVDSSGKLQVAVNGTVGARPVVPASPWFAEVVIAPSGAITIVGPSAGPINVTSLSLSLLDSAAAGDNTSVGLSAYHVPDSATSCSNASLDKSVFLIPRLTASAPFAVAFPTPLHVTFPAGTKGCLESGQRR